LEFGFGHKERGSGPLSFGKYGRSLEGVGWWMPTVAVVGIQLFYSVVMAWCIRYFLFSFNLAWGSDTETFFYKEFLNLSSGPFDLGGFNWGILISTLVIWVSIWAICFKEVNHGIEKACLIFMPLLFLLTGVLVIWTLTLDGAWEGIRAYIIDVDMSKLKSTKTWVTAFGQIFFSLSLGFGIMITYASYLPRTTSIVKSSVLTTIFNCGFSIFAGFSVFATLGFMANAKGVTVAEVVKSGPGLAFITYPEAINQLPFGQAAFGMLFFFTLIIAGLSSGISLVEAFTCSITDKFKCSRGKAVGWVCTLGFLGSTIFTTNAGLHILDIVDHFVNNYGILVGGLLECLLISWVVKARLVQKHINENKGDEWGYLPNFWNFLVKFITPVVLVYILYVAVKNDLAQNYGGYTTPELLTYGVLFLFFTCLIAVVITYLPWKTDKHPHTQEEDHLIV
jgi:NSS family neurotransmitter:Na+ symporter